MNRNLISLALCALVGIAVLFANNDKSIVIDNVPVSIDRIDSIVFHNRGDKVVQSVWHNDVETTTEVRDNITLPTIDGLDVSGSIYHIKLDGDTCTDTYVTPIGYFFRLNRNLLLDEDDSDLLNTAWYYESFDAKKWTLITIPADENYLGLPDEIEYESGTMYLTVNKGNDVNLMHYYGNNRCNELEYTVQSPGDNAHKDSHTSLLSMLGRYAHWHNEYRYSSDENLLQTRGNDFVSLLGLPVVELEDGDMANKAGSKAKKTTPKAKKKVSSAKFTIYPLTGKVNDLGDTYVGSISGAIKCASSKYLESGSYGILIDTDQRNLYVGKAKYDIPCRQEKLKLSFNTETIKSLNSRYQYYYRTYAKLNKAEMQTYSFKYAYKGKSEAYGAIREFETAPYMRLFLELSPDPSSKYFSFKPYEIELGYYHSSDGSFDFSGSADKQLVKVSEEQEGKDYYGFYYKDFCPFHEGEEGETFRMKDIKKEELRLSFSSNGSDCCLIFHTFIEKHDNYSRNILYMKSTVEEVFYDRHKMEWWYTSANVLNKVHHKDCPDSHSLILQGTKNINISDIEFNHTYNISLPMNGKKYTNIPDVVHDCENITRHFWDGSVDNGYRCERYYVSGILEAGMTGNTSDIFFKNGVFDTQIYEPIKKIIEECATGEVADEARVNMKFVLKPVL